MRPRIPRLVALAAILAACAADPTLAPRDCTPGQTATCACAGASGVQTCGSDGRLGACACPDAGGADVVAVIDAPAGDVASLEDRPTPMDTASVADALDGGEDAPVDDAMTPDDAPEAADALDGDADGGVPDAGCSPDLMTDRANCGACGRACSAGQACAFGTCTLPCASTQAHCRVGTSVSCFNLRTDNTNCGACGNACPGSLVCRDGACSCPVTCGGACADLQSDPENCGRCGIACSYRNATGICTRGVGSFGACRTGFADCNNSQADGCEAQLGTVLSCARCGDVCNVFNGYRCESGRCVR